MSNWQPDEEVLQLVRKYALQNALEYDGKGIVKSVQGRILGEVTELRKHAAELVPLLGPAVDEANQLWADQGADAVRKILEDEAPDALEKRVQERREGLPELEDAEQGKVVLRFAPNPNGPLSLGHSRGVVINSQYAEKYDGELILRFDDTDTKNKPPDSRAYDWIIDEFNWLTGKQPDRIIYASDRMGLYLKHASEYIAAGHLYVCTCSADHFRKLREGCLDCKCRSLPVSEHEERWTKMNDKEGEWWEGDAVVRVKSGMQHSNPALRDWPALRIQTTPHTRVGEQYRVWPLLDFQSAVEDHEQGVTHIIRGKDLMDSTRKQTLLYDMLGWNYPETKYWGRVKVHEFGGFSTSQMKSDISEGKYTGWDDVRLPTIQAMRRRGYAAESLREFWIGFGLTQKDIQVSMATLISHNASILDADSPRLSFVRDPVRVALSCEGIDVPNSVRLPIHPEYPEKGVREWPLDTSCGLEVYIDRTDYKKAIGGEGRLRLKDFADIELDPHQGGRILQLEKSSDIPIVHWLVVGVEQDAMLIYGTDDGHVEVYSGKGEIHSYSEGQHVQFERLGFARLEELPPSNQPRAPTRYVWTHG